jgi:hypothetical protein
MRIDIMLAKAASESDASSPRMVTGSRAGAAPPESP